MIDAIGGRKIVAALVILAVGVAVVIMKGDIPANLLSLLQVVFGAFVIGNGVEHVANAVTARAEAAQVAPQEAAPVVDHTPFLDAVTSRLDALEAATAQSNQGIGLANQALEFIINRAGWGNTAK